MIHPARPTHFQLAAEHPDPRVASYRELSVHPGAGRSEGAEVGHWAFPILDPFPPCPSLAPAKWVEHYMGVAASRLRNSVAFKVGLLHRARKSKGVPGHHVLTLQSCLAKTWSSSMPRATGVRCRGTFSGWCAVPGWRGAI